ncbi:MAG: hypothetical protein ACR2QO_24835 [Acidimicrobiales bacterium]
MKRILSWRAFLALVAGLALVAAACGSDDEDAADDETTTTEAGETTTSEAEETTTSEAEETTTSEAEETTTSEADGGTGIGVVLNDDFEIVLASDPAAGSVTFNVANEGPDFPHALTIVKGASLDDLPRNDANGAVDTEAMDAADIIGSTSIPLDGGTAEDLTVDLEAGDYVFFCPIQNETQSHVGAGQVISVTVAG